jgi:hypothetical protein
MSAFHAATLSATIFAIRGAAMALSFPPGRSSRSPHAPERATTPLRSERLVARNPNRQPTFVRFQAVSKTGGDEYASPIDLRFLNRSEMAVNRPV